MNLEAPAFTAELLAAPDDVQARAIQAARRVMRGAADEETSVDGLTALSVTAAAKLAGVSRPTLYLAVARGGLRCGPLYPGGRPRVLRADLVKWLQGRRAAA